MKAINTIKKEIIGNGFSILETYSENRISNYFNILKNATKNTFVFREFFSLNLKNKKIREAVLNKEIILVLFENSIYAVQDREAFYSLKDYHDKEVYEIGYEDYNNYLNLFR